MSLTAARVARARQGGRRRSATPAGSGRGRPALVAPCGASALHPHKPLTATLERQAVAAWDQLTPAAQVRLLGHPQLSHAGMIALTRHWEAASLAQRPRGSGRLGRQARGTPVGQPVLTLGPLARSSLHRRFAALTGQGAADWIQFLLAAWRPLWVAPLLTHPDLPVGCQSQIVAGLLRSADPAQARALTPAAWTMVSREERQLLWGALLANRPVRHTQISHEPCAPHGR